MAGYGNKGDGSRIASRAGARARTVRPRSPNKWFVRRSRHGSTTNHGGGAMRLRGGGGGPQVSFNFVSLCVLETTVAQRSEACPVRAGVCGRRTLDHSAALMLAAARRAAAVARVRERRFSPRMRAPLMFPNVPRRRRLSPPESSSATWLELCL
jgi:hypothetical protein